MEQFLLKFMQNIYTNLQGILRLSPEKFLANCLDECFEELFAGNLALLRLHPIIPIAITPNKSLPGILQDIAQ